MDTVLCRIYFALATVLYMSFGRFFMAVGSRDLFQADKSFIDVSSFSILQNFNWSFGPFFIQKIARLKGKHFSQFFLMKSKSERIQSIHFAESSGLRCLETEKEVLLPITQLRKGDTLTILLSAWDRSRDLTAKRNLSTAIYKKWQSYNVVLKFIGLQAVWY